MLLTLGVDQLSTLLHSCPMWLPDRVQLCGDGMAIDYDQLLAKQPQETDAVFSWHQDMAYWPSTEDRRTATESHALGTELRPADEAAVLDAVGVAGETARG
jgi:hypothetical protein